MKTKHNSVILFANTLWFLQNFKRDLVEKISEKNTVHLVYLAEGPPSEDISKNCGKIRKSKLISTKGLGLIKQMLGTRATILAFTIIPIYLTPFLFPLKAKSIATIEGLGRVFVSQRPRYRILKQVTRIYYRFVFRIYYDYVCALNHADMNYLVQNMICGAERLKYIPGTGVDTKLFDASLRRSRKEDEPIMVAFIGRMKPEKGVYTYTSLAEMFKELYPELREKVKFKIITPKETIDKLSDGMMRYLLKTGVKLYPYSKDQTAVYRNIDAIVLPTQYGEGLSRVLLESACMKIPVITTDNSGTRELISGKDYGYILNNPSNVVELAELLYKLINDKEGTKMRVERLHERVHRMFAMENSSDRVLKLIESE